MTVTTGQVRDYVRTVVDEIALVSDPVERLRLCASWERASRDEVQRVRESAAYDLRVANKMSVDDQAVAVGVSRQVVLIWAKRHADRRGLPRPRRAVRPLPD